MKSAEFFKREIEQLRNEMQDAKKQLSQPKVDEKLAKGLRGTIKRNKKKIEEHAFLLRYIETNPSEDFLKKEVDRLSNRINKYSELYKPLDSERVDKKTCSAHKKAYEKEMGIPKLRKQLTAVAFLTR